jgi:hypothetical protein
MTVLLTHQVVYHAVREREVGLIEFDVHVEHVPVTTTW